MTRQFQWIETPHFSYIRARFHSDVPGQMASRARPLGPRPKKTSAITPGHPYPIALGGQPL